MDTGHFNLFHVENMASKTDPPQPATVDSVMALVQEQLKAAAAREAQLTKMLEKVMDGSEASPARLAQLSPSPSPSLGLGPSATIKPVSVEQPMLISSANMADFVAWEEAWRDYARCQRLDSHNKATRSAAIRQALDEDLRRFVREGIITMPSDPDADDAIVGLKSFIRRQRNPLLDRIAFFERRQQKESLSTPTMPI